MVETKLESTLAEEIAQPAAVPVVTAEEAEKLNAEALLNYEIKTSAFRTRKTDMNILEGTIKSLSNCPAPEAIDYPDCNLTVEIELNDDTNTKIFLIVPCIRESKKVLNSSIKDNELLLFRVKDDKDVSDDEKSIQIVDDFLDVDKDYYYIDFAVSIETFSGKTKYVKKSSNKKVFDKQTILSEKDFGVRNEYLKNELNRLNAIIDAYSQEDAAQFEKKFLEYSKTDKEDIFPYTTIGFNEEEPKKFFSLEKDPLAYISSACSFDTERLFANASVIASIRDFLGEKGIHLIVIPVPQKSEAVLRLINLSNQLSTYNIDRILLMKYLIEMDVEIIDIEPYIERNLLESFYYHKHPKNNPHFTSGGNYYFAQHILEHIQRYDYFGSMKKNDFSGDLQWYDYNVTYNNQSFKKMKNVSILSNDKPISNHSPFLLIGDSFTMESLRESLAYAFSTPISTISATSASPTMTRILQMRQNEIPKEAKICFFVFYSRYLHNYFTPFISKDSIQLYPDGAIDINSSNFDIEGQNLQKELCVDFSVDLSSYSSDAQSYTLLFNLSSTKQQVFIVTVNSANSTFRGKGGTRSSGHGAVSVRLTKEALQHPLNINVMTIPYTNGAPIINNMNLTLKIDKILLSNN